MISRLPKKKKCAQCGTTFNPNRLLQVACSYKCALAYNTKKEIDKRVKQMRKDIQSLSDLRAIARSVFQTYIRMRDEKYGCISCGRTDGKFDAGHYLKCEIYTGLIFDEVNCHRQCAYCNNHLQGNVIEYREGLIKRIGRLEVELLEARKDISRTYKFSKDELIEIAAKYREKIKELKRAA